MRVNTAWNHAWNRTVLHDIRNALTATSSSDRHVKGEVPVDPWNVHVAASGSLCNSSTLRLYIYYLSSIPGNRLDLYSSTPSVMSTLMF